MNILQHLVFPNFDIDAPDNLYVRVSHDTLISRESKNITFLKKGAYCGFDTYFNSFTIQTWKNQTPIRQLKLRLHGQGEFILKIKRHKLHTEMKHLSEHIISLDLNGIDIDFADLNEHTEGMLFFELIALSENAQLDHGYYHTDLPAINQVKLGIVITHFNRKHYVLPAINRVSKDLLQDPYYKEKISLIVVDNSQNITPEEAQHAFVIPNKNLGGSGGFTRGLMYLEDEGSYTHCLFMDDDASCEIESIRRAYALLQYATEEKFAVAGAQLRELAPWQIHAKGELFKFKKEPIGISFHQGLDSRNVHDLLIAEYYTTKPNYGGWWLFAFKISEVNQYSFPFFIRADDISFSLRNKFSIQTLNGISVWGEDFFVKESPLTRYYGFRNTLICTLFENHKMSKKTFIKVFTNCFFSCVSSYNYSSADAFRFSLIDFLTGTKTFIEDMDASKARAKLAQLPQDEKMQPINRIDYDLVMPKEPSRSKRRTQHFIRKLTLNYLLMPEFWMKNKIVFQPKHFSANLNQIYRYKQIYYEHEATRTGYIATFSKARLLKAYIDYFKSLWLIYRKFDSAKADYISKEKELTSRQFWENIYSDK